MNRNSATVAAGVTRLVRDSPDPSSSRTESLSIPARVRNSGSWTSPHSSCRRGVDEAVPVVTFLSA